MSEPTCGICRFGRPVPKTGDLRADMESARKLRVCFGAPPQLIVIPGPGGFALQTARPNISVDDLACAMFRDKLDR